jgi:aminoacrylate hydrolase
MATLSAQGISIHYELLGDPSKPPVLLISGLGGSGVSWGSQAQRFATDYFVIVPDQRGTGKTTQAEDGYSIAQLARDMASLLEHLQTGPAHLVGSSTGGAIAQVLAIDHPQWVRSVTMSSSFARADAYMKMEFALRRKLMAESDMETVHSCNALFLFLPEFVSQNADAISAWVKNAASHPTDREIAVKRIDMIMAHDVVSQLGRIQQPSLVVCGDHDNCTPLYLSQEITSRIPNAKLVILSGGGHFIHQEQPEKYYEAVRTFIDQH